jgi:hypothetical protein
MEPQTKATHCLEKATLCLRAVAGGTGYEIRAVSDWMKHEIRAFPIWIEHEREVFGLSAILYEFA